MSLVRFAQRNPDFGTIMLSGDGATITAGPETDWFFEPYGKARRQNVPSLIQRVEAPVFSLQAKVETDFASAFDGGTLFVETSLGAWGKIAFEYSPQSKPTIVSVVTKDTSDDCDGPSIDAHSVFLRLYAQNGVFALHFSNDGRYWRFLRWFSLPAAPGPLTVGLSSQSPTGKGCRTQFSEVELRFEPIENLRDGR